MTAAPITPPAGVAPLQLSAARASDQEFLRSIFNYDSATGRLTWRRVLPKCNITTVGQVAGNINEKGYYRIGFVSEDGCRRHLYAHQIAWIITNGPIPSNMLIDHVDRNPLNNAICNLRLVSRAQNYANSKMLRNNTSGYKGVTRCGKKWQAAIRWQGKRRHLGVFETPEMASAAYQGAARLMYGPFVGDLASLQPKANADV